MFGRAWRPVVCGALITSLLGLFGCGSADPAPPPPANSSSTSAAPARLTVLVAASAADAVEEAARLFEIEGGAKVVVSPGASNALAQQILAGADGHLFLSANEKWAEEVRSQGLAAEVEPLLTNRLVIVVPKGNPANVRTPADLTSPAVTRLALAGESVPAGIYADQSLRNWGIADALKDSSKIVRGSDVRVTLAYVERGEAEAGIVFATDARVTGKVEVVATFPPESHDPLVYPLVLIRRDGGNDAGRKLYDFLKSSAAAEVFRRHGFESAVLATDGAASSGEK